MGKFETKIPLKVVGTQGKNLEPIQVTLLCFGIEPVVYLQPQRVFFDNIIIGEGNTYTSQQFTIHNPHLHTIDWQL